MLDMEKLLSGVIPESLEDKTAAAGQLVRIARRIVPVTSLLIASARRDHFANSVTEWVEWCSENFELDGAERDHYHKIGRLLLAVQDNGPLFTKLFETCYNKLICLARIPANQIAAFLSHFSGDIRKMTREEVRDAVKSWLGEAVQERQNDAAEQQSDLPEFADMVHSILRMQPKELLNKVHDETSARLALNGGFCLFGLAMEYKKKQDVPDVEFLQTVKLALLTEISEIEEAIARAAEAV